MKKVFALLLAATMMLSLAACGSKTETPTATSTPAAATSTPAAASSAASATDGALEADIFETPVLLTTAGQSADGTVVQALLSRAGVTAEVVATATSADLDGVKTLIIVAGGSSKGLGSAGVDENSELARTQELIDAAKAADIKILAMHVGGSARRGTLSDKFIGDPMDAADAAIIVSAGDSDGMISGILNENGTPYQYIEKQADAVAVLETIFK